jgi:anti-anti-sigma factor
MTTTANVAPAAGSAFGIAVPLADNLKVTLERINEVDDCLMVYLDGSVCTVNAAALEQHVVWIMEHGYRNLIFNCAALTTLSSAGVGSFAAFVHLLKNAGGDIALLMVQPLVADILDLLGLTAFFHLHTSTGDAVEFFRRKEDAGRAAGVFPRDFDCPECHAALAAPLPGRYRCATCNTILTVDAAGGVLLG